MDGSGRKVFAAAHDVLVRVFIRIFLSDFFFSNGSHGSFGILFRFKIDDNLLGLRLFEFDTLEIGRSDLERVEQEAGGGAVEAGVPYIVGERRAELFVPETAGTIRPTLEGLGTGTRSITL